MGKLGHIALALSMLLLGVGHPALAQDAMPQPVTASGMLCDTQDELEAIMQSGDEAEQAAAAEAINTSLESKACASVEQVRFFPGKVVRTIRGWDALFDVVPVYVIGAGNIPIPGNLQWTAFRSCLIEVADEQMATTEPCRAPTNKAGPNHSTH